MICTVKYSEVTADGLYRHPVFIGIREDKATTSPIRASFTGKRRESPRDAHRLLPLDKRLHPPSFEKSSTVAAPFPDGIEGDSFYHKNAGKDAPTWIETVTIFSESNSRDIEYIVCNDKETLGYLINLGCIELNPWSNRVAHPGKPDWLIIDLDPSDKNTFKQVIEAATTTREVLDQCGVTSYCKTSGSTGIHIFIPMGAAYSYDQVRDFAHLLMQFVQQRLPDTTTLERSLKKRGPKIYLDYLQNREGQTVASAYSARPKPGATVSMPVEWDELTSGISIQDFTIHNAYDRLSKRGDLFLPVLDGKTDIEKAIDRLGALD